MNTVCIIGILKEVVDDYNRFFEYQVPYEVENETLTPRIIVRNWTGQPKSRLIILPLNTRVALHAHLELTEKFGTILLVEQLEVLR